MATAAAGKSSFQPEETGLMCRAMSLLRAGMDRASPRAMRRALLLATALCAARTASAQEAPESPDPDTTVSEEAPKPPAEGFAFGSYGRVMIGTDVRGSSPEPVSVVAHGSRVVEPTY